MTDEKASVVHSVNVECQMSNMGPNLTVVEKRTTQTANANVSNRGCDRVRVKILAKQSTTGRALVHVDHHNKAISEKLLAIGFMATMRLLSNYFDLLLVVPCGTLAWLPSAAAGHTLRELVLFCLVHIIGMRACTR